VTFLAVKLHHDCDKIEVKVGGLHPMVNTKVKEITQAIINAIGDYKGEVGDVDGADASPEVTANPDVCTFGMHAWADYERPEKGQIVYTVTVEAKFVPDE
jgi:hypothetical protein